MDWKEEFFYLDAPESEIYYFNRLLAEAPELLADIWTQLSETELFTARWLLPQIYRGVVSQAGKGITLKRGLGLQGIIFKFAGASGKAV